MSKERRDLVTEAEEICKALHGSLVSYEEIIFNQIEPRISVSDGIAEKSLSFTEKVSKSVGNAVNSVKIAASSLGA